MNSTQERPASILDVAAYAAEAHAGQTRKDARRTPYINHPLRVAWALADAGIADDVTLAAALLHDVVEDTPFSLDDVRAAFGPDVAAVVGEVTDDRTLPKADRKRAQVATLPGKSARAKAVKLADKLDNLRDLQRAPPAGRGGPWSDDRVRGYAIWAQAVLAGARGTNAALERRVNDVLATWGLSLQDDPAAHAADLEAYYASLDN